jgi:hypothetical protein
VCLRRIHHGIGKGGFVRCPIGKGRSKAVHVERLPMSISSRSKLWGERAGTYPFLTAPPHFSPTLYRASGRLAMNGSGQARSLFPWETALSGGAGRISAKGKVVDRAGFEPAYACTGRFTVCCL